VDSKPCRARGPTGKVGKVGGKTLAARISSITRTIMITTSGLVTTSRACARILEDFSEPEIAPAHYIIYSFTQNIIVANMSLMSEISDRHA